MDDGQTILAFSEVRKSFGSGPEALPIVGGVTFDVDRGEFITLLGPSGCGKSTLLNMSAGLMQPTSGSVAYDGAPVQGINLDVGYMTQADHLLPWRTIAGNIAVPLEIQGLPKAERAARIERLLTLVGLDRFGAHYPSQVSGGMRKRAALARLLAADPATLLMDEPFSALDAQLRLTMQGELLRLCARFRKTVLFVTHDLDEAITLADRCVVLGARPTTIRRIVPIDLPRPRDPVRLRTDPRYHGLYAELWDLLSEPSAAAPQAQDAPSAVRMAGAFA
ncbi:ABC transporter ATP-binding protein [Xanthobacter sp. KR7-225]|uniref:ABC transporter ATP-binding protein n=1 Tax=Xanthobacter sp. KR7-225 TaxID=3156613 RepID=UPI0032B4E65D